MLADITRRFIYFGILFFKEWKERAEVPKVYILRTLDRVIAMAT